MIQIKQADEYRICNVCHEKASIEIDFHSNEYNMGTTVALCERCRKDNIKQLNRLNRSTAKLRVEADVYFEEMCISAIRYALGRRTYIVNDTCNYIMMYIKVFTESTLKIMKRDIEERRDMGAEYLGDGCDVLNWMRLLDKINKRISEIHH